MNPELRSIFVSYRREDSAAYAGRICDHLELVFGEDQIFLDVEDIRPGQNFAQTLDERIADCAAFLAIIGPKWAELLRQRLQDGHEDYVRHEIEAALARKATIIPVLVGGASMAQLTNLPQSLEELSLYEAAELNDNTFKEDCTRLAAELASRAGIKGKRFAGKNPLSKRAIWIAAVSAVLLLLAIGVTLWRENHARNIHVQQVLNTARTQTELGEYEPAFKTYEDALKIDPDNQMILDRQADAAMLWLRNFHVLVAEGQSATDIAGPPLAAIMSVLHSALSRTNGRGTRAADLLAHLGWAHWLNRHIAEKEFGPAAEQDLRRSLTLDPLNVYGNAMLGNWLLQTNGNVREAVQHFEVAVKSNKERAWVRTMQLGGMEYSYQAEQELIRAVNAMRMNAEPISASDAHRVLSNYSLINSMDALRRTLSAVPAEQAWATYQWLDKKQQGRDPEERRIQGEFIHANILEVGGQRSEALALFLKLQREIQSRNYSTRVVEEVDAAVKRLSMPN
ncbi:MAG TPA: TIR domain-containing protein [Bryobacteraceae bacterium]|jgi:tetratricopeptide (TPR) repeat protein|nr:TIR domain-containing protein [Bryobacteraceae bacterium]